MTPPPPDKDAARREARVRLRALDASARADASAAIGRAVWTLPEVAAARTLLLFASLPGEVETAEIAAEAVGRGIVVTYPRCLPETRELALHAVAAPGELVPGAYGIREPDALVCPLVSAAEVDVVLVPGLAWDRAGRRLGRGAGYYDRLFALPAFRAFRCGLFFAAQELHEVPVDAWDVAMDAVVTEREVWRRAVPAGG
ncbi:MAG: 5-formyltetrahydrofolate cyclo-ligase [Gemmatimonadetes bacterium]|nr:5-formyltetrahydrofolate cyclo-ligase [Gemmatimonadota bacterium]